MKQKTQNTSRKPQARKPQGEVRPSPHQAGQIFGRLLDRYTLQEQNNIISEVLTTMRGVRAEATEAAENLARGMNEAKAVFEQVLEGNITNLKLG